eukprot:684620_1
MSTGIQAVVIILYTVFSLNRSERECDFNRIKNHTEYHTFTSLTKMLYAGSPPNDSTNFMGYKKQSAGVNDNGTIYIIGGLYQYRPWHGYTAPQTWWMRINVYDSYIAYDDTVDIQKTPDEIQSAWTHSSVPWNITEPFNMPDITPPHGYTYPTYNITEVPLRSGFYCASTQCSAYLNNKLYVFNPTMVHGYVCLLDDFVCGSMGPLRTWPKLIIFVMDDTNPHYLTESQFTSDPPYNSYSGGVPSWMARNTSFDKVQLTLDGCTTHNHSHILHFNAILPEPNTPFWVQTTYSYNPETDEWSLLSGNTANKYYCTCQTDTTGRFVYLFAGTHTPQRLPHGIISLSTDRYDTWTDTWIRLPSTANYPERYGRQDAL